VVAGGCRGWQRAHWSARGGRVYIESELSCADGRENRVTSAWLFDSQRRWLELQAVREDDRWALTTRRYGPAASPPLRPDASSLSSAAGPAREPSRFDAADVIEALEYVDAVVVEAMLMNGRPSFPISSRLLVRLDEAGVPDDIIDLMVALTFPNRFSVDETTGTLALLPSRRSPRGWSAYGVATSYHPYGLYDVYGPYAFGHIPWYPYHGRPPSVSPPRGAVAISGHGYTRIQPTNLAPVSLSDRLGSAGGGGGGAGSFGGGTTGGSVAPQGHSRGGSQSKGIAKPR
jgi:hypothetical protein